MMKDATEHTTDRSRAAEHRRAAQNTEAIVLRNQPSPVLGQK